MATVIERAKRKGFFTDTEGGRLIEFQFNPTEVLFNESTTVNERNQTGQDETDLLWVSGAPERFIVSLFIDRSYESQGRMTQNVTIDDLIGKKEYNFIGKSIPQAIKTAKARVDGTAGNYGLEDLIRPNKDFDQDKLLFSDYNPSPHINPNDPGFNRDMGVWLEYKKFREYLKPVGWKEKDEQYIKNGLIATRITERTFTPPPMAVLFFGDLWIQGYFVNLRPRFSVFTPNLIPLRMEIEVEMTILHKGILTPVGVGSVPPTLERSIVHPSGKDSF